MKPFDLILVRSRKLLGNLICFVEKCVVNSARVNIPLDDERSDHERSENERSEHEMYFSHVGIVVDSTVVDDPLMIPGVMYILESCLTCDDVYSIHVKRRRKIFGVQVRPLAEAIKGYALSGCIVRRASLNTDRQNVAEMYARIANGELKKSFTKLYKAYLKIKYDPNPCSLCGAAIPKLRRTRNVTQLLTGTKRLLFCSELVTNVLQDIGVLAKNVDPRNVVPQDFVGYDIDNPGIPNELYLKI